VLIAVALVSLGCGLLFGGLGGFLLGRLGQERRISSWRQAIPTPELGITPETPRRPRTPQAPQPSVPTPFVRDLEYGALVMSVVADSPADEAGLQRGDIITAVEGEPLSEERDLAAAIQSFRPGVEVRLTIWRGAGHGNREELTLRATLTEKRTEEGATIAYLGVTVTDAPWLMPYD